MTVPAVGGPAAVPFVPPAIGTPASAPATASGTTAPAGATGFGQTLASLEQLTTAADTASQGVATGNLSDVSQFTVAAAKATLAVQLTAALRNRAVEAYQDIMRMQV